MGDNLTVKSIEYITDGHNHLNITLSDGFDVSIGITEGMSVIDLCSQFSLMAHKFIKHANNNDDVINRGDTVISNRPIRNGEIPAGSEGIVMEINNFDSERYYLIKLLNGQYIFRSSENYWNKKV